MATNTFQLDLISCHRHDTVPYDDGDCRPSRVYDYHMPLLRMFHSDAVRMRHKSCPSRQDRRHSSSIVHCSDNMSPQHPDRRQNDFHWPHKQARIKNLIWPSPDLQLMDPNRISIEVKEMLRLQCEMLPAQMPRYGSRKQLRYGRRGTMHTTQRSPAYTHECAMVDAALVGEWIDRLGAPLQWQILPLCATQIGPL